MTDKKVYKVPERLTIPKTKRLTAPNKMIFVDVESTQVNDGGAQVKHILKLGHAFLWERPRAKRKELVKEYAFNNAFDFWQWVDNNVNQRETIYLFAHNVTFDFLVLEGFRFLPLLDFTLQSIYSKFTTTVIRFSNNRRRLVAVDTMNYFPVSLEKVAASVGMRKTDIDFSKVSDAELADHCRQDALIIYEAIKRMIAETVLSGLGSFKLTASSLSHSIYRHSFMKDKIMVSHKLEVVEFEQSAYTGGVTALSKLVQPGDPELYKLDVNSMYPSVMIDRQFPTQLIEFAGGVNTRILERFLNGYLVIARVKVNTDEAVYPMRYDTFTAYPKGEFITTLTTESLKYALEKGHIIGIEWMSVYMGAPIFKDFISEMYGRRLSASAEGDAAREMFFKSINNTLYGKFGQRRTETVRIGDADINEFCVYDAFDGKTGEEWKELHAGGSILFIYQRGEARYTSYAIAAHITDYARGKLFELRRVAGPENVFYMDTDSLIVNAQGAKNLNPQVSPGVLGALKIEDRASFFVGFAKKDYILGDVRRLKGFDVKTKLDDTNVIKSFNNVSIMGAARHDLRGGAFWREVNKRYSPFIVDAHINKDGTLSPIQLPQEDYLLGHKRHTLQTVKTLVKSQFTNSQKKDISTWIKV